jgi:hypothetical protein
MIMTIGFLFWLLMILWIIFGLWARWPLAWAPGQPSSVPPFVLIGGTLLEFILFFLLGWKVFGFVIQG